MTGWNLSPRARFDPPIRPKLGFSGFRTVAITVTLILAVALCVVLFVKQNVHDHLRARITDALNERLRGIGYTARLESARWIEGSGLHLEGLSIKQNIDSQSNGLISIGKIFARSSFRLTHILSGKPRLESLLIEDLRAHLSRSDKGPWNIEPVIQALLPQDAQSLDTFPIRLRRAQVSLDGRALGIDQNLVINGINLDFHHDSNSSWDRVAVGHFSGPLIERVEFQLWIDSHRQRWQSRLSVNEIQLTGELGGLVPSDLKPQLEIIKSLQGEISLVGEASGSMDLKQVPAFQVKGSASRLQWLHPSAPYPVHNGRLSFTADNSGLRISEASADVGYGHLKFAFQRSGWLIHQGWHLSGEAQDIELTPRLVQWLPAKMQKAWSEYDPTGRVNIDFTLHHRNGKTTHEIRSRVVDGSFSYHRFPFRINQCSGRLNWIDDVMTIDLHALESQQPVRITGRISQPGNDWTGYINVECDGYLPLNEKLFRAFKYRPNLERTLRQFHSHGHFGVVGRLERHDPSVDKPRLTYHVDIKQANVRYENFDYPFYNVNGRIRVVNDSAFFESFIANNGQVTCNGHWYPESGLKLRFHAQTVLLDDELRSALPGYLQDCWSQLRPSGTVDHVALDWQFDHHTGKIKTTIDAEIYPGNAKRQSSVSLRPVWFPYEFRNVSGQFRYGDNELVMTNLQGQHGKSWVSTQGVGRFGPQIWQFRFHDLICGDIIVDEELLTALPISLAASLRAMRFEGQLTLGGIFSVAGRYDRNRFTDAAPSTRNRYVNLDATEVAHPKFDWDVQLAIGQGNLFVGVPLNNVNGLVRLKGGYHRDNLACHGQLELDSLIYRDVQITRFVGPISIDNHRAAIGSLAAPGDLQATPASVTGRVFGGKLQCDCQLQLSDQLDYFFQATLFDANLRDFALETSMQQPNLSGRAYAGIQLGGNATGSHSIKGRGYVNLRNAKIYELPIMLALLKVLRIREPDRTAFDSGDLEFTLQGDNIDFNKIELNGDSVSLIGLGNTTTDFSQIDLDFYTVMGRNRLFIPILTNLYRASSQQVLWIKVGGTLDDPQTTREVLPALNDHLKRLFQDFDSPRVELGGS